MWMCCDSSTALVVNLVTAYNFAVLLNCMQVGRCSASKYLVRLGWTLDCFLAHRGSTVFFCSGVSVVSLSAGDLMVSQRLVTVESSFLLHHILFIDFNCCLCHIDELGDLCAS